MGIAGTRKEWSASALGMDTVIRIQAVTSRREPDVKAGLDRAFQAFQYVEQVCSRFNPDSEVMRLTRHTGTPAEVSDLLFQALRFALEMAEETDGAFDPTVGRKLETYGFNHHYLTGETADSGFDADAPVSWRDIVLDEDRRTVTLRKPAVIDLGAVAKGLAVDLAAKELAGFEGFVIDAGGDIYAGGLNAQGEPWRIGIRHPLEPEETITSFPLSDAAVCTSGTYERPSPVRAGTHHLIDPVTGASRRDLWSCSVIAPFAMLADAASTAAFVLGREAGSALLNSAGIDGIFVDSSLNLTITNPNRGVLHD